MLATAERVRNGTKQPEAVVWHRFPRGQRCAGDCDFHAIACSDEEGIACPGPLQDIPLDLDAPRQSWCPDCLATVKTRRARK